MDSNTIEAGVKQTFATCGALVVAHVAFVLASIAAIWSWVEVAMVLCGKIGSPLCCVWVVTSHKPGRGSVTWSWPTAAGGAAAQPASKPRTGHVFHQFGIRDLPTREPFPTRL